ncbi:hypothetical protein C8R43DRAFT_1143722 [Mycena crocata]|nr:hypothetical protein C8R43DRAFT_1143722 [Mycena crocata]
MNLPNDLDTFPDDILTDILYHAFWECKDHWFSMLQLRATLSSINRRCMILVQGNSRYWDVITVFRFTPAGCLETWLGRTSTAQLTLRVHAGYCDGTRAKEGNETSIAVADISEFHTLLLPVVQQDFGRVRSLYVSAATHADTLRTFDVIARFGIGSVEEVKLHNWQHRATGDDVVRIAPLDQLANVVLEGIEASCLGSHLFKSITTLRLGGVNAAPARLHATHILEALAEATAVVVLQLDDIVDRPWPAGQHVCMPSVEDFWMVCSDDWALSMVTALRFPNLRCWRGDLQGHLQLHQLQGASSSQFGRATKIELCIGSATDSEVADFCLSLANVQELDFRFCSPPMGVGLLISMTKDTTCMRSLDMLRLSIHTNDDVKKDILRCGSQGRMGPRFLLTTGLKNPQYEPEQRWFLDGVIMLSEDHIETGAGTTRWINVGDEEYLELLA